MPIIILILSIANLFLAVIAYIPSILTPNTTNSKELGSIALSSTKTRKMYALIFGLCSCTLYAVLPNSEAYQSTLLSAFIINALTIILSYVTQMKLWKNLRRTHALQSIAVIKIEGSSGKMGPTSAPIELWLKKSKQDWPPVNLEIGIGPWVVLASCINNNLLEQISSVLKDSKLLKEIEMQNELKKVLNQNGVTHPMDIDGCACIPEIQEFFEKTLIKAT